MALKGLDIFKLSPKKNCKECGSPTCMDRYYASMMGALAVDLLIAGKTCRVVGYRHGEFVDFDINEALAMQKGISDYQWEVCQSLSHNYDKNNK